MRNRTIITILFLFSWPLLVFSGGDSWGHLKKIYFYNSVNRDSKVVENLNAIDLEGVKRAEREGIVERLIQFGDHYFSEGKSDLAEAFYKKVVHLSPQYWYLYNKLAKIKRAGGAVFPNIKDVLKQSFMAFKDFKSSFLIFNNFFNVLFFSGLLIFFLFAVILFARYFKLAGNDLLINKKGRLAINQVLLVVMVLLWPIFVLSGWIIYPFLVVGFLWGYLNPNERKTVYFILALVVVVSLFYSLNAAIEKSVKSKDFEMIRKLDGGHLFEKEEYQAFDNELKVVQAYAYYENRSYNTALDILGSTGEEYESTLKFDLLGNIYFKLGNISQSIQYYKESLRLNEKSAATLSNFTLALLRNDNQKVFDSWAKRYPAINNYKGKELSLKELKRAPGILWKRLFHFSREKFSLPLFLKNVLAEFSRLPVLYYILFFFLYILLTGKIWFNLGESTYCSKCAKIIKERAMHKSHQLCDDCHQLFLIKDVIFLEAKILKEKELKRRLRRKYTLYLLFSLVMPGLNLKYREKDKLFVVLSTAVYVLLGFSVVGMIVFNRVFSTAPLFLNFVGAAALILYFLVNLFSVLGEEDGI